MEEFILFLHGLGMDGNKYVKKWLSNGISFMYTANHPNITVIYDIFSHVLSQSSILVNDIPEIGAIPDELSEHTIFPVYSSIGELAGIDGPREYLMSTYHLNEKENRQIAMEKYISESFNIYDRVGIKSISTDTIVKSANVLKNIVIYS